MKKADVSYESVDKKSYIKSVVEIHEIADLRTAILIKLKSIFWEFEVLAT